MPHGWCPRCGSFWWDYDDHGDVVGDCECPHCDWCGRQAGAEEELLPVEDPKQGDPQRVCQRCWDRRKD